MEDRKIRMKEQELTYKKGFKWHTLPYADIVQAYMRIEEVNGKMCCGVANFNMHFLMLRTRSGELLKMDATAREKVEQMLKELKQKNPEIKIGYEKKEK